MPQQFEIGQGATALEFNLFTQLGSYGWLSGAGVTLGGSTSAIECNVDSGTVLHDGRFVDVSAQTVTLQPGDPQHPRKDLVYVDREGTAKVRAGVPDEPVPSGNIRGDTYVPAPPPATAVDGVSLAEVWVPSSASSSGDLQAADVIDRRVAAVSTDRVRELASDPADDDLVESQLWRNTTANELRAYFADVDEVHSIDTTLVRSVTTGELIVEDFEDSIHADWKSGVDYTAYNTPAFEGSAAAYWDEGGSDRNISVPGDGLDRYPDSGDTIALAVYGLPTDDARAYVAFGKENDDLDKEYRLYLYGDGELRLQRADTVSGTGQTLGSTSISYSSSTWYIIEAEYDGGGQGVHPFRVYSTSGGARDTVLAEDTSPTSDTTYRGRGIAVGGVDEYRVDRLGITPG